MKDNGQSSSGTIRMYEGNYKEKEFKVVESELAPVVRTYEELEGALSKVENCTKIATSGFFNPIHKNHISSIVSSKNLSKNLLDSLGLSTQVHLTVVVNGDWSCKEKLGGKVFLGSEERADIVRAIKGVDLVFIHDVEASHQGDLISLGLFDIFTKGGDRDFDSLPQEEQQALIETGTVVVGNVGYDKFEGTNKEVSSSVLRKKAWGETL